MVPVISALGKGKSEGPWSLLAGQSSWIIKLPLQGQILSWKIRQTVLPTRLSFPQSLMLLLSYFGLTEWRPQRGVARRKSCSAIDEMVTWDDNTWFTSASVEWTSRSMILRKSKKARNVPWRRWGPQMCAWIPVSIKPSGAKGQGMFFIGSVYTCAENTEDEDSPNICACYHISSVNVDEN